MPADLAIQLETTIGLCFMVVVLFLVKLGMVMVKDYCLTLYRIQIEIEEVRHGTANKRM